MQGKIPVQVRYEKVEAMSKSAGEEHPSIWDYPEFYELLLQAPDSQINAEISTIVTLLKGHEIRSGRVLEIGCGPAAHCIELAKRGFAVVGLDRSPAMLQRAQQKAEAEGVSLALHCRDATSFNIPEDAFDCVIFMSETFPLVRTDEALLSHFASVRAVLRPGGLYIVDIDRSKEGVGVDRSITEIQSAMTADGIKVEYWLESYPGDWVTGSGHLAIVCRFDDGKRTVETRDEWRPRRDCPTHLTWLIRSLPDWELVGFFSPMDGQSQIEHFDHYFMMVKAIDTPKSV
jgi:SAM-dependent methyltransferase